MKTKKRAMIDPTFDTIVCDMEAVRNCPTSTAGEFFNMYQKSVVTTTLYSA